MKYEMVKRLLTLLLLVVIASGSRVCGQTFNPTNPPEPNVKYKVKVSCDPSGSAWTSGGGAYLYGQSVTINTSSSNSSYVFDHWTLNGEKYSTDRSFIYTVEAKDANFVAHYIYSPPNPQEPVTINRRKLFLESMPEGCASFSIANGTKVNVNNDVYVSTYGNAGFKFQGWYDGDELVSTQAGFYYTMPNRDATLKAKYVFDPDVPQDPGFIEVPYAAYISVSAQNGAPGDEVDVKVSMTNTKNIYGAEIVIPLNENLHYVKNSFAAEESRLGDFSCVAQEKDGQLHVMFYNIGYSVLPQEVGDLFTFKLKLGSEPGTYSLMPEAIFSNQNGGRMSSEITGADVKILAPKIAVSTASLDFGRVPLKGNYSKTLSVSNTGNAVLHISGITSTESALSFSPATLEILPGESAEVAVKYNPTVKGSVSASVAIASDAVNGLQTVNVTAEPYSLNVLSIGNASGMSGEEVSVGVSISNMESLNAVQFSLELPAGVEYVDGSLATAGRSDGFCKGASVSDGALKLFLYTMDDSKVIAEGEGEVASFKLRINAKSGTYNITPSGVVLGNSSIENAVSDVNAGNLSVISSEMNCEAAIDFGSMPIGATVEKAFELHNAGGAPLVVNAVTFASEGFSIKETLPLTVAAGADATLTVVYDCADAGDFASSMNISTNDPVEPLKVVSLSGKGYEPNEIYLDGGLNAEGLYLLNVSLKSYSDMSAMQMDFHVPAGVELSDDDVIATERLAGFSHTLKSVGDNTYRLALYSLSNSKVAAGEGAILSVDVSQWLAKLSQKTVTIDNIIIGSTEGENNTKQTSTDIAIGKLIFKLTFKSGETILSEADVAVGTAITTPENPTKAGYTFAGWSPAVAATMPANDVTYTAQFTVNSYVVKYYVGETVVHEEQVDYGECFTLYEYTPEEGFVFNGWIGDTYETMPAHDIEYRADISTGIFVLNAETKAGGNNYDISGRRINDSKRRRGIIVKRLADGRVVKVFKK